MEGCGTKHKEGQGVTMDEDIGCRASMKGARQALDSRAERPGEGRREATP